MRTLFATFFFAVAVLAVGMMFMGAGGEEPAVTPTPIPLTEMEQRVEGALSRGASLFLYEGTETGYAICSGNTKIVTLRIGALKEFRLTSQEALNLSLCRFDPETGNYNWTVSLEGVAPGDFLHWTTNGLSWTP